VIPGILTSDYGCLQMTAHERARIIEMHQTTSSSAYVVKDTPQPSANCHIHMKTAILVEKSTICTLQLRKYFLVVNSNLLPTVAICMITTMSQI